MLSKLSVKKPYTVLVSVLLVIVIGVVSLSKMTMDLLPNMSFPYVIIITTSVGSSPKEVETNITAPIEASMATTSNIKTITSRSSNSYSMVMLEYEQSTNMDSTIIEIQQQIEQLKSKWDDKTSSPIIMQVDPDMLPIMNAAVDVEGFDANKLSDYINNEIKPSLESVEGVASVSASGQLEQKVNVYLDQGKIDVLNAKIKESIEAKFKEATSQLDNANNEIQNGQNKIESGKKALQDTINNTLKQKEGLYKKQADVQNQLEKIIQERNELLRIQQEFLTYSTSEAFNNLQKNIQSMSALNEAMQQVGNREEIQKQIEELQKEVTSGNLDIRNKFEGLQEIGFNVNDYASFNEAAGKIAQDLVVLNTQILTLSKSLGEIIVGTYTTSSILEVLNSNASIASMEMAMNVAKLQSAADKIGASKEKIEETKNSTMSQADLNSVLSMDTLSKILIAQNFDMPAGYVTENNVKYLVSVGKKVKSVEELENLPLIDMKLDKVSMVRLNDIARIDFTDNSDSTYARVNNKPGILLAMEKQTGYSTGDVTKKIKDKFNLLEKENNKLKFTILMDQGIYIDIIVKSVVQNMIMGAFLAILVLLVFLRDWRTTIIIAFSIPMSVIFAIVLMYFMGITLNIISMSGLALGIGMLVDNSIVVVENIFRMKQETTNIKRASIKGAKQVGGAIIASTLTTVSVYAPIIFTEGITRQLFVDLALTVTFTLVASLIVALTVVPAMSSKMLEHDEEKKIVWFEKIKTFYESFLRKCLNHKVIVILVTVLFLCVSFFATMSRGMIFMNMEMETNQISVTVSPRKGETLKFKDLTQNSDKIIEIIRKIDGVKTVGAMTGGTASSLGISGIGGSNSVTMYVILKDNNKRSLKDIEKDILNKTKNLKCNVSTNTSAMDFDSFLGSGIEVQIKGKDIAKLQILAKKIAKVVNQTKGVKNVNNGLNNMMDEFSITIDKEKAAENNFTVAQAFQLVYEVMKSESPTTTIETDLKDYKVYLVSDKQNQATLEDIKNLSFKSKDLTGKESTIPLKEIANFKKIKTLSTINRDAQSRYISVSAAIDENHNVALVSDEISKKIDKLNIPEGYTVEMVGEDENIKESMNQLMLMLVLAVIFIYLIMVAQFQSLLSPFIIMFTIPLAFTGGFIGLFITKNELSVIAMIGFIMLAGLIVNNGIVLIDYINQARKKGLDKQEAILSAGLVRIRPILMTALTTILSMSTMALGIGEGSELMQPMAITIIGGMVYGTLLTLVVEPCIYDIVHRKE
ncbi:efflux RND transporter permease subunit [Lachnobacterium bovis]|uniref:Hydrophobic/amphiphilic exporter-1, HAE1 family n=1 Tax=Lachnobacterium bovis TaxID=140626 RepID=A0A1H9P638_9FIRM|nr:efflux RND transporter permease subunit [Lachnobacterium bovis]SER43658.1 hydrophobic/amphiphilic exporter-1, HAE1 family [Lachnobacterium bovis]